VLSEIARSFVRVNTIIAELKAVQDQTVPSNLQNEMKQLVRLWQSLASVTISVTPVAYSEVSSAISNMNMLRVSIGQWFDLEGAPFVRAVQTMQDVAANATVPILIDDNSIVGMQQVAAAMSSGAGLGAKAVFTKFLDKLKVVFPHGLTPSLRDPVLNNRTGLINFILANRGILTTISPDSKVSIAPVYGFEEVRNWFNVNITSSLFPNIPSHDKLRPVSYIAPLYLATLAPVGHNNEAVYNDDVVYREGNSQVSSQGFTSAGDSLAVNQGLCPMTALSGGTVKWKIDVRPKNYGAKTTLINNEPSGTLSWYAAGTADTLLKSWTMPELVGLFNGDVGFLETAVEAGVSYYWRYQSPVQTAPAAGQQSLVGVSVGFVSAMVVGTRAYTITDVLGAQVGDPARLINSFGGAQKMLNLMRMYSDRVTRGGSSSIQANVRTKYNAIRVTLDTLEPSQLDCIWDLGWWFSNGTVTRGTLATLYRYFYSQLMNNDEYMLIDGSFMTLYASVNSA
jgi:hypothetical protein